MKSVFTGVICIAIAMLAGCATVRVTEPEPGERVPAGIDDLHASRRYEISVQYFNQNEIGVTESVDDIRALVLRGRYQDHDYFRWLEYAYRSFEVPEEMPIENRVELELIDSDEAAQWEGIQTIVGFDYLLDDTIADSIGQLGNMPDLSFLESNLDTLKLYMNVIDFHMWDIYIGICFRPQEYATIDDEPLSAVGDVIVVPQEGHMIDLAEFESVSSDLQIGGGLIYLEMVGYGEYLGERTRIIYFQQNQQLSQYVYGPLSRRRAFRMPYNGTNRFMGFFEVTDENELVRARFNEYVYGKVDAPFFIDVYVHHKREYTIDLVDE